MNQAFMENLVEKKSRTFIDASDRIWDFAEVAFHEYQSSQLLAALLEEESFSVTRELAGIPTALFGEYGNGGPVIGILGEYDALPGLSQESGVPEQKPLPGKAFGHGCGHNLLGAGALAAAVALKDYMQENHLKGTVRFFGCPAEETCAGKAYMIREGCFDGLDVCLSWHPSFVNMLFNKTLAVVNTRFAFKGISAHASADPENGRSALDAAELMNVASNYLREHIVRTAQLHYAYLNAGSAATNIVHPEAEVEYCIRGLSQDDAVGVLKRVNNIAKGAALMTDTKVESKIVSGYANFVANKTLDTLMMKYLEAYSNDYTNAEIEMARKFQEKGAIPAAPYPFFQGVFKEQTHISGSTDVGDVSWNVPTAQCCTACYALGSVAHSWCATAQGKSTYAHKGMKTAAKILASVGAEILENPSLVQSAWDDLAHELKGAAYQTLIPEDYKPYLFKNEVDSKN